MAKVKGSIAKLSRPRLYDAVPRERLFEQLDRARKHPLVWVGAPPGAGKTTLVGSWLDARRIPFQWYQVDSGDGDPATFFSYLVKLSGDPTNGLQPLPYLTPEYLRDLPGFARRFFREFFARAPKRVVLVLDNMHEAAGEALHGILLEAAQQTPPGRTIVVITRAQPPLAFARLQANNDLATVDWDSLRLTPEETSAIVRHACIAAPPTPADLHARTDGWAAGLILLLAHLQRGGTERSLASLGSRESIFAYFAGEVFDRAPPQQREILMRTALFSQVTPAMAEELTGDPSASQILEQLYRLQYFTDRRSEPELSFRYHDLFREFLFARAEAAWSPQVLREYRVQAAGILKARNHIDEAMELLLAAKEFERAVDVIEEYANGLLAQGRWVTLQRWLAALPGLLMEVRPWLCYWLGTSYIPIEQRKTVHILAEAYRLFAASGNRRGELLSVCGIAEAISLMLDDVSELGPWIPILERLVIEESGTLSDAERFRVWSSLLTAMFWCQPGHPGFGEVRAKMHGLVTSGYDAKVQFSGGLQIVQVANLLGDWAGAREIIDRTLPAIESGHCSAPMIAQWCAYVGYHHYVMARDAIAWDWFRRSEEVAVAHGMEGTATMVQFFWCYSAIACGDAQTAREVLDRAHGMQLNRAFDRAQNHLTRARLATLTGERTTALSEIRAAVQAANDTGCPMMRTFWNCSAGSVFADFGCYEESAAHLQQARKARDESAIGSYDAFMLMLDAYLSLTWRRDGREIELLRQSLAVARARRNHYYYRTFIREIAARMLDLALERDIDVDFAIEVIRELRLRPTGMCGERWPWRIKVHSMGSFAIQVDGYPLTFGRKVPKKPLALLQCLISLGGEAVAEHRIADALWPDADGDDAQRRLTLAVHRLRNLLGDNEVIRVQAGRISLDRRRVWVDALFAEDMLALDPANYRVAAMAQLLGRGVFLQSEPEELWVLAGRKRFGRLSITLAPDLPQSVSEKKTLLV